MSSSVDWQIGGKEFQMQQVKTAHWRPNVRRNQNKTAAISSWVVRFLVGTISVTTVASLNAQMVDIGFQNDEQLIVVGDSSRFMKPVIDEASEDDGKTPDELKFDDDQSATARLRLTPGGRVLTPLVAPADGIATISLSGDFDTMLRFLDSQERSINWNDDTSLMVNADSAVECRLKKGERYFVETTSYDGESGGDFTIQVKLEPEGQRFDDLETVEFGEKDEESFDFELDDETNVVEFWVVAKRQGHFSLVFSPIDMEMDTTAWVLDEDLRLVEMNDDPLDGGSTNATVRIIADKENKYLVRASNLDSISGPIRMSVQKVEGENPIDSAIEMEVKDDSSASLEGEIDDASLGEFLKYTAPTKGNVTFVMRGLDGIDSVLSAYDESFRMIATNDDAFDDNVDSAVTLMLQEQESVYLKCSSLGGLGKFTLIAAAGGMPSPFDDAKPLAFGDSDRISAGGETTGIRRKQAFVLNPEQDLNVVVSLQASMASEMKPILSLYDPNRDLVFTSSGGSGGGSNSAQMRLKLHKGGEYYFEASAEEGTQGPFSLSFRVESQSDIWDYPRRINLKNNEAGVAFGKLDRFGAETVYQVVAPATQRYSVIVDPQGDSQLNPRFRIFDSERQLLAANNDLHLETTSAGDTWQAEEGEVYYLLVLGDFATTGDYRVKVSTDPLPSPFDSASNVPWEQVVSGIEISGSLTEKANTAYYRFIAEEDKVISATFRPAQPAGFDAMLERFDSDLEKKDESDDYPFMGTNSALTMDTKAGETYYLRLSSLGEIGEYRLQFMEGKIPSPFDDAIAVGNDLTEKRTIEGEIQEDGEMVVYEITLAEDLDVRISLLSSDGRLDTILKLYDEERNVLSENDDADVGGLGTNSRLTWSMKGGKKYYITASGYESELGKFKLELEQKMSSTRIEDAKAFKMDDLLEGPLLVSVPEDHDPAYLKFTAKETRSIRFRASSLDFSSSDPVLKIFDAEKNLMLENDDADGETIDAEVVLEVEEGKEYFVAISSLSPQSSEIGLSATIDD